MTAVVLLSKKFFPAHAKAGEETGFKEQVLSGAKIHTCRCNFEYWKKKTAAIKAKGGVLSVRQWAGKAYRSPQEVITEVPAEAVEVQRLVLYRSPITGRLSAQVDGKGVDVAELAKNDGLSLEDFSEWFTPVFVRENESALTFAVIHFTDFRY